MTDYRFKSITVQLQKVSVFRYLTCSKKAAMQNMEIKFKILRGINHLIKKKWFLKFGF